MCGHRDAYVVVWYGCCGIYSRLVDPAQCAGVPRSFVLLLWHIFLARVSYKETTRIEAV